GSHIGPRRLGSGPERGVRMRGPSIGLGGAVGQLLGWLVIGGALIALVMFIVSVARAGGDAPLPPPPPRRRERREDEEGQPLLPEPAKPRSGDWKDEAARLALAGRHGEAVHALLLHAIGALARARKEAPPESRTSRELLEHFRLAGDGRDAFAWLV